MQAFELVVVVVVVNLACFL